VLNDPAYFFSIDKDNKSWDFLNIFSFNIGLTRFLVFRYSCIYSHEIGIIDHVYNLKILTDMLDAVRTPGPQKDLNIDWNIKSLKIVYYFWIRGISCDNFLPLRETFKDNFFFYFPAEIFAAIE